MSSRRTTICIRLAPPTTIASNTFSSRRSVFMNVTLFRSIRRLCQKVFSINSRQGLIRLILVSRSAAGWKIIGILFTRAFVKEYFATTNIYILYMLITVDNSVIHMFYILFSRDNDGMQYVNTTCDKIYQQSIGKTSGFL